MIEDASSSSACARYGEPPAGNGDPALSAIVELAELQAENDRLRKIKLTTESNGILFYRPHLKQHRFHICNATGRYGRTGNRFGKSEMGIAEDIAQCRGGREWYRYEFDIIDGNGNVVERHPGGLNHPYVTCGIPRRPIKLLILVVDWEMAHKVFTNQEGSYETWGKLFKLLPAGSFKTKLSRGGHVSEIFIDRPKEFGGGVSSITIDTIESWKHNKLAGESADWDVIHVDEPCPEEMFKSYARGLADRNGRYYFTCTPLDQMWINDKFTPPGMRMVEHTPDSGIEYKVVGTAASKRFIITGSSYDNPFRNDAGLQEMASGLTSAERACRIDGLPKAFSGVIYREFIYDLHVLCDVPRDWDAYDNPPLDYTIRVAWDVHDAKPQAILCVATSPQGIAFVCKEFFFDRLIQPNVDALKEWLEGRNVVDLLIDPKAVNPDPRDESTILDDLWGAGLPFDKASKDLTLGISRVREKLNERRVTDTQLPTICFSPDDVLTETLWEFSHYIYDAKTSKPKDQDDHMMENLYRLVINGLDYVEPSKENEYRIAPLRIRPNEIDFSRSVSKPRSLLSL